MLQQWNTLPLIFSLRIISLQLKLSQTFSAPRIYNFRSHWQSDFVRGLALLKLESSRDMASDERVDVKASEQTN